jgi:hypothetical protein
MSTTDTNTTLPSTTTTTATTTQDLPTLTILPSDPSLHTHTVIFLHGRGDNTRSFTRFLHNWRHSRTGLTLFESFPTFRWVFPQAPLRPVASTANNFRQQVMNRTSGFVVLLPFYGCRVLLRLSMPHVRKETS